MKCRYCGKELSPRVLRVHERKCQEIQKRQNVKAEEPDKEPEEGEKELTIDDLEVRKGGHYYLDGDHVAHGEQQAKEFIDEYNGGAK